MRKRSFRPGLESLDLRIAPSSVAPGTEANGSTSAAVADSSNSDDSDPICPDGQMPVSMYFNNDGGSNDPYCPEAQMPASMFFGDSVNPSAGTPTFVAVNSN